MQASPAAAANMRQFHIYPSEVKGTGKHGIITKSDVILFTKTKDLTVGKRRDTVVPKEV